MQQIMELKNERKSRLMNHPFYRWVKSNDVALERRFDFTPILALFVMNFRDMNKWFIRFPNATNEFERIINGNTLEDETHSRLYMEDWKKLGMDEKLHWRASDTLWWLFLAPETEPFRRFGFEFAAMTVEDQDDPLVRFAHSEAGEACGNAFFNAVSPVAGELQKKSGIQYRYYGQHHLDREPGHVLCSEGVFESQVLSDAQRERALELANRMFDVFFEMHDCFDRYARTYVAENRVPRRPKSAPPPAVPTHGASVGDGLVSESQRSIQARLEERKVKTAAHPFYSWLRTEQSISPVIKLQRFVPMWVMDIMGYRDLNRYALHYAEATDPREKALNLWASNLETHNVLFLQDWDELKMDEALGWSARDTLKFCFLDPQMDVHRRNMSDFIKLALRYKDPALRFWLMHALESSGEAFFQNTRAVATQAEQAAGIRLDYLGDRHDGAHAPLSSTKRVNFKSEDLSPEQRDVALHMLDTIFNAVDEQLSISLDVSKRDKFGIR
jgi:hypothetical protein